MNECLYCPHMMGHSIFSTTHPRVKKINTQAGYGPTVVAASTSSVPCMQRKKATSGQDARVDERR